MTSTKRADFVVFFLVNICTSEENRSIGKAQSVWEQVVWCRASI